MPSSKSCVTIHTKSRLNGIPFLQFFVLFVCEKQSLVIRALVVGLSLAELKVDINIKDCGLESEGCQPLKRVTMLQACSMISVVSVHKVQTHVRSYSILLYKAKDSKKAKMATNGYSSKNGGTALEQNTPISKSRSMTGQGSRASYSMN